MFYVGLVFTCAVGIILGDLKCYYSRSYTIYLSVHINAIFALNTPASAFETHTT